MSPDMTKTDFLSALEDTLEIDQGSIDPTGFLKDAEWWDSMAALVFISVADEKLNVLITGGQLQQCEHVSDLLALLGDKLTA